LIVRKAKHKHVTRTAIVIGASSGIGAAVAVELARCGYVVGIAARRALALSEVAAMHPGIKEVARLDLHDVAESRAAASALVAKLGGVDVFVISAGIGNENPALDWAPEAETVAVNVTGFVAMATVAMEHFARRGQGHLVGISSIAAIRGHGEAPAYGASKAFVSSYLRALRHKCAKQRLPVDVTEVQPGFVATAMAKGDGLFWVAPVEVAARQIVAAIESRRAHVYVTKRWRVVAAALRIMPEWIYNRV
jgi:short-subunit dehydrogenase